MGFAVALVVVLFAALVVVAFLLRRFMRDQARANQEDWSTPKTDVENPSAFMAASMQGVIEKLRAQEKELARLHLLAQERAQESERLTEEVTRNMPTGLLLVNATGAISSTNPAAEEALGIRTLRYRSYKEILGADSELTQMLTACMRDGKTFQRGEVEHLTSEGEPCATWASPFRRFIGPRAFRGQIRRRRRLLAWQGAASAGHENQRRALPDE